MKGGNLFSRNWLRVKDEAMARAGATAWAADFEARVAVAGIKAKKMGALPCCPPYCVS